MKEFIYLEQLKDLCEQLKQAAKARPYDSMHYNRVIEKIEKAHSAQFRRRRRVPWFAIDAILCLILIFAWLVWEIVTVLYFRGPQ